MKRERGRRGKMKKILCRMTTGVLAAVLLLAGSAAARDFATPVEIFIATCADYPSSPKTPCGPHDGIYRYRSGHLSPDPLILTILLANVSGVEQITTEGFSAEDYRLHLSFHDLDRPGSNPITAPQKSGVDNPISPLADVLPIFNAAGLAEKLEQVVAVERLYYHPARSPENPGPEDDAWERKILPFDAWAHYPLRPGRFRIESDIHTMFINPVNVITSRGREYGKINTGRGEENWKGELFSHNAYVCIQADGDGDEYFYPACAPGEQQDCDDGDPGVHPGAAEVVGDGIDNDCNAGTLDARGGKINFRAYLHEVGPGAHPDSSKIPLAGLRVRLFDKSEGSCVKGRFGVSSHSYGEIAGPGGCPHAVFGDTDANGEVSINAPAGDYIAIADHEGTFIGASVGEVFVGDDINKLLQVIRKVDGKKGPDRSGPAPPGNFRGRGKAQGR
jgi:hypothetical protein